MASESGSVLAFRNECEVAHTERPYFARPVTTPIVLIPGVMGSRLDFVKSMPEKRGFTINWDMDHQPTAVNWVTLAIENQMYMLDPRRPVATMTTLLDPAVVASPPALAAHAGPADKATYFGKDRNWASVLWSFYGTCLSVLEVELNVGDPKVSAPVYAFGYDWRASNLDSGLFLYAYLKELLERHQAKSVICVTHSMGGLVFRSMLTDPKWAGWASDHVKGVIHVAMPSVGAPLMYMRYANGAEQQPSKLISQARLTQVVLSRILGETPEKFRKIVGPLIGPNQLLPVPSYNGPKMYPKWLEAPQGTPINDVYVAYAGIAKIANALPPGVQTTIRDFASKVTDNVVHSNTYVIAGTGQPTSAEVTMLKTKAVPWDRDGDGTVPFKSAHCDSLVGINDNHKFSLPGEHAAILTSPAVLQKVTDLIKTIGITR